MRKSNNAYARHHYDAYKAGHCINPVIPPGMTIEEKRRYLVGWMEELQERNYEAWAKPSTIEIVRDGHVIATFGCHAGKVSIL